MDTRPHTPGDGSTSPLLADEPLPPGSDAEEIVDAIDKRIRDRGSAEAQDADESADASEGQRSGGSAADRPRSDAAQDPTDDGADNDQPA
ncbi:MAG: hypothetical protein M3520_12185 [Actinomycetota bacterium]|jgi:hypothetical protein|nr:hypothetical protein [Actinomycetota bacterium]